MEDPIFTALIRRLIPSASKTLRGILKDMIHLWRMHRFARLVREQTKALNGDISAAIRDEEVIDPETDRIIAAFKCRRKKSLRRFTDNEVTEIYRDMIEIENKTSYCKPTRNSKKVNTLRLNYTGKRLSEFMGYAEELQKNRRRSSTVIVSVMLSVITSSALAVAITHWVH